MNSLTHEWRYPSKKNSQLYIMNLVPCRPGKTFHSMPHALFNVFCEFNSERVQNPRNSQGDT